MPVHIRPLSSLSRRVDSVRPWLVVSCATAQLRAGRRGRVAHKSASPIRSPTRKLKATSRCLRFTRRPKLLLYRAPGSARRRTAPVQCALGPVRKAHSFFSLLCSFFFLLSLVLLLARRLALLGLGSGFWCFWCALRGEHVCHRQARSCQRGFITASQARSCQRGFITARLHHSEHTSLTLHVSRDSDKAPVCPRAPTTPSPTAVTPLPSLRAHQAT
jgi:hypothetical protein